MARTKKLSLESTAYHEAGHALVAYRFSHYGDILTIGGGLIFADYREGWLLSTPTSP